MAGSMNLKFPKLVNPPAGADGGSGGRDGSPKKSGLPEGLASIRSEIVFVTPDLAKDWLATSPGNRHESPASVEMYARAITSDTFVVTHQGVAFDDKGRFRDGHHRLYAIIEANKGAHLMVTFGIPSENFDAVDLNKVRTAADILGGMGAGEAIDSPARRAAIARALMRLMNGFPSQHIKLSIHEIRKALTEYAAEIDWAMALKRNGAASIYAALAFAWPVDRDKIQEFATELIENHSPRPKAP